MSELCTELTLGWLAAAGKTVEDRLVTKLDVTSMRTPPGGLLRYAAAVCVVPAALLLTMGIGTVVSSGLRLLTLGAIVSAPVLLYVRRARTRVGTTVQTIAGGIQLGERPIPYEQIVDSFESGTRTITLRLRDRSSVVLEMTCTAAEALTALGFAPEQRTVREPLTQTLSPFTKGFLTLVVSTLTLGPLLSSLRWTGIALALAFSCLLCVLCIRTFGSPAVVLGADGVRVLAGFHRHFVSFADLEAVRCETGVVTLRCRDGAEHDVRPEGSATSLAERIERSWRAYQQAGGARIEALARGARSLDQWRAELATLATRQGGFRDLQVGAHDLELELRDAGASADRRIGAAIALRAQRPEAVERIRLAAGACADEALREALEAVCDDSLDEHLLARAEHTARR